MRKFVIGDIHGCYKALMQCLKKSEFNYEEDQLIVLGDVVDGYPQVRECIDELLKIKNLIYVMGNHDQWALEWMISPWEVQPMLWITQGGRATKDSYLINLRYEIPESHIDFLKNAHAYYVDDQNNLFVHGGIDPNKPMNKQSLDTLIWDRKLIQGAQYEHFYGRSDYKYGGFKNIYIGHTTTEHFKSLEPIRRCNVVDIDTGAGWSGKLSIMNIETGEFFQSESAKILYPNSNPRK